MHFEFYLASRTSSIFWWFYGLVMCTPTRNSMFCLNGGFDSRPWRSEGDFGTLLLMPRHSRSDTVAIVKHSSQMYALTIEDHRCKSQNRKPRYRPIRKCSSKAGCCIFRWCYKPSHCDKKNLRDNVAFGKRGPRPCLDVNDIALREGSVTGCGDIGL